MADISKLISSLAKNGRMSPSVPARNVTDVAPIYAQVGTGVSDSASVNANVKPSGAVESSYKTEVASLYSIILITADGAYEAPPLWPDNRTYPPEAGTLVTNDTIELVSGQYRIAEGASIYEQKRVHASIFVQSAGKQEVVRYAVRYEIPLQAFHRAGADTEGLFYTPTMYLEELPGYSYDASALSN